MKFVHLMGIPQLDIEQDGILVELLSSGLPLYTF